MDPAAVQAAVDRGGRVLLRGSFDFGEANGQPYNLVPSSAGQQQAINGPTLVPASGILAASRYPACWADPPQTVFITSDVEIHGDSTTLISGGYRTFTVGYRPLPFLHPASVALLAAERNNIAAGPNASPHLSCLQIMAADNDVPGFRPAATERTEEVLQAIGNMQWSGAG